MAKDIITWGQETITELLERIKDDPPSISTYQTLNELRHRHPESDFTKAQLVSLDKEIARHANA